MSSPAFMGILNNSLDTLRLSLGNLKDYEKITKILLDKARKQQENGQRTPIDIPHISQVERVCPETFLRTVEELQKLGVVHLWFRVRCPSTADYSTENIIIETDSAVKFQDALQAQCNLCGDIHSDDVSWECIDRFWRFNTVNSNTESFDPELFFV